MMKTIRIFFLCFLLQMLALVLTTSCCESELHYVWKNVFLTNMDNRGETLIVLEDNELPAIAYTIGVELEVDFTFGFQPQKNYLNDFANTAYATSCSEIYILSDTLLGVRIYALNDFDATHPSGAELTEYFVAQSRKAVNHNSSREDRLATAENIPTFIEEVNTNVEDAGFSRFDLLLLKSPETTSNFQFVVELETANKGILRDTTENVILY